MLVEGEENKRFLGMYLCSRCGRQKYYETDALHEAVEPILRIAGPEFRTDGDNVDGVSRSWRRLPLSERSRMTGIKGIMKEAGGEAVEEGSHARNEDECQGLRFYDKHQFKRVLEDGRYQYRCIHCGISDRYESPGHYVTALGILDKKLPPPRSFARLELRQDEEFTLPEESYDDDFPMGEPISDLGYVYGTTHPDADWDHDQRLVEPPTSPLTEAVGERDGRYRRIARYRKLEEVSEARNHERICPMLDKIRSHLTGTIDEERLDEGMRLVNRCLNALDRLVFETDSGRITPRERWLSEHELEALAAAATYHYFSHLTQEMIAESEHSIFPDLTTRTLRSYWKNYIVRYDG